MKEKAQATRGLDTAAIQGQLKDQGEQMFRLRFQMSMGQTEGLKKLRDMRKERARMLTVLRERELGLDRKAVEPAAKAKKAPAKKAAKPVAEKAPKAKKTAKAKAE
jgi:large subunit ribosomal protein L29